jgi:hypothetical protein
VLRRHAELRSKGIPNTDAILNNLAKDKDGTSLGVHNHSPLDFQELKGGPDNIGRHLADHIAGFSENIRKIFERLEFDKETEKPEEPNRLYQVVAQFTKIGLHPRKVDNITMGLVFEDLIRRFDDAANEKAGDHFKRRDDPRFATRETKKGSKEEQEINEEIRLIENWDGSQAGDLPEFAQVVVYWLKKDKRGCRMKRPAKRRLKQPSGRWAGGSAERKFLARAVSMCHTLFRWAR